MPVSSFALLRWRLIGTLFLRIKILQQVFSSRCFNFVVTMCLLLNLSGRYTDVHKWLHFPKDRKFTFCRDPTNLEETIIRFEHLVIKLPTPHWTTSVSIGQYSYFRHVNLYFCPNYQDSKYAWISQCGHKQIFSLWLDSTKNV